MCTVTSGSTSPRRCATAAAALELDPDASVYRRHVPISRWRYWRDHARPETVHWCVRGSLSAARSAAQADVHPPLSCQGSTTQCGLPTVALVNCSVAPSTANRLHGSLRAARPRPVSSPNQTDPAHLHGHATALIMNGRFNNAARRMNAERFQFHQSTIKQVTAEDAIHSPFSALRCHPD